MSGLFSQNNLLLCGMQGSNALLGKKLKAGSRFRQVPNFVV